MLKPKNAPLTQIKIAIVDDQQLFRAGLTSLLKDYEEFKVMLEASHGRELLELLKTSQPDVVLLDIEMPEMDGIETAKHLLDVYPGIKIIILTMHNEDEFIFDLMQQGAHGFLPKDKSVEEVVEAIHSVVKKGIYYNSQITRAMVNGSKSLQKFASFNISDKEIEIIQQICKERTNKQIGEQLGMSTRTIEKYRSVILTKIGAKNTVGVVVFALKHKLISMDEIVL